MIVETTFHIARPRSDVFAFLADQTNWARIDPALVDLSPTGTLAIGKAGTMTRRVSGLRVTTRWTVVEFQPDARLTIQDVGKGYALTEDMTLEDVSGGTRLHVVDTLLPTSLPGRLFVAMSGPFIRRDLRDRATRLTALLESGASPPEGPVG